MEKPNPLPKPNFTELIKACQDYMDFVASDDFTNDRADDYESEIFERALLAVFGHNTLEFVNTRVEQAEG